MEFQKLSRFQAEALPRCLAFCPQFPYLFIGDTAGNLLCHDVTNGARLTKLQGFERPVVAVGCYQNDIYCFDQLQNLISWNLSTFQVNQTYSLTMHGGMPLNTTPQQPQNYQKEDLVEVSWLQSDVNGNYTKLTKRVPLWTVATARFTHSGRYLIFGVNSHPQAFYTSRGVSALYMIDVETGSLVRQFDWEAFFTCPDVGSIDAIAISRDDTQLAVSGLDIIYSSEGDWSNSRELIHQWCLKDGAEVCGYEYDAYLYRPSDHERVDLAFSPDMSQILCSRQGWLSLWNVPSPQSRRLLVANEDYNYQELPLHSPGVFDWSPVSNLVAFGSPEGLLRFVDIATLEVVFEQQVSQAAIQQVLFSQNGEFLAVYSQNATVEIWSIISHIENHSNTRGIRNVMIEEQIRTDLQERQWTVVAKDVTLGPRSLPIVELWKQYANGVAITLSMHDEEGQFVLFQDVGHAASGTKRTNCGTFPTATAAIHQLVQMSYSWDHTWEM